MTISTNNQHAEYIQGMKNYISTLESMSPAAAKKEAKNSLMRSGILTKRGKIKKRIVNN